MHELTKPAQAARGGRRTVTQCNATGDKLTVSVAQHDGRYWLKLAHYDQDMIDAIKQWFPVRRRGWDEQRRLWWVDQSQADGISTMLAWHQVNVQHVDIESMG